MGNVTLCTFATIALTMPNSRCHLVTAHLMSDAMIFEELLKPTILGTPVPRSAFGLASSLDFKLPVPVQKELFKRVWKVIHRMRRQPHAPDLMEA
jgi:hypothetical protein